MTTFVTKVWGFHEPVGPLIFREEGWRRNALEKLEPGDVVVMVGTQSEPTHPDEQGRLLGIMEPTSEIVMSLDYEVGRRDRDFDEEGNFKWPYGLLNSRAWRLLDRPLLSEITDRRFSMDSISGIVALLPEEASIVTGLRKLEATLAPLSANAKVRME